jgi:hypothetical protein
MPDWWPALDEALSHIQFETLPPSTKWNVMMDDVEMLSVHRQFDDGVSKFSVFYAPNFWPALPGRTHEALQRVVSILDPLARALHST